MDETLTAHRYLDFLRYELIPALTVLFPNEEDADIPNEKNYAAPVREFLFDVFPNRWIESRGGIEWPRRSPDLTPLDFSCGGIWKEKFTSTRLDRRSEKCD